MIIADENIPNNIIEKLRAKGIDVYSVYESNRGASDEAIIEISKNPRRIILTEDKDFGEWVFAHGIKSISVVFLRYVYSDESEIAEILFDLIEKKGEELFGMFLTVSTDKIRYRKI